MREGVMENSESIGYPANLLNGSWKQSCRSDGYRLTWQAVNRDGFHPIVLYQPYGVTFAGDDVAVAEGFWPYSRIQVFNADSGQSCYTSDQGEILPYGIATVDSNRLIAVTDHNDRTVKFLSVGARQLISSWPSCLFDWPTGIAVDSRNYICTADWFRGEAYVCDQKGAIISSFKTNASATFSRPVYLTIDSHRRIIISDALNHCISIFDEAGRMLNRFGQTKDLGFLEDPRGVATDCHDNILVADWEAGAVKKYSPDGLWIADVLNKRDEIMHPWGIAVDRNTGYLALTEHKLCERSALKMFK